LRNVARVIERIHTLVQGRTKPKTIVDITAGLKNLIQVKEGVQHKQSRLIVQFYLETARDRVVVDHNYFQFKPEFVKDNKLEKRFQGHSYDIVTQTEVIEIDDLSSHPNKSHQIADGIAEQYIREYHPEYRFYRLLKEEVTNEKGHLQPTAKDYLREHLF